MIPQNLHFELKKTSNDEATEMLFLHTRDNSSLETVHRLCNVMISKKGFPKMSNLGQDMKEDLQVSIA